ncbi:MAG: TfoX family protein [Chloroflexi bacterium]|nr:MAG: TfoX family protein [Chloroflexota bacterium]
MAYDEQLAERVRELLMPDADRVRELKMFGGLCFTLAGNMAVGLHGDRLIVRVDPSAADALLAKPHVAPFDLTGRPMRGWLFIYLDGLKTKRALAGWVDRGCAYAASLPPK